MLEGFPLLHIWVEFHRGAATAGATLARQGRGLGDVFSPCLGDSGWWKAPPQPPSSQPFLCCQV